MKVGTHVLANALSLKTIDSTFLEPTSVFRPSGSGKARLFPRMWKVSTISYRNAQYSSQESSIHGKRSYRGVSMATLVSVKKSCIRMVWTHLSLP